ADRYLSNHGDVPKNVVADAILIRMPRFKKAKFVVREYLALRSATFASTNTAVTAGISREYFSKISPPIGKQHFCALNRGN
ncbi:hypothetical protein, partial [Paraburkholderia sediminicola]|uniref:hypothetical protein n=1 Tax=Paraburkholderia sediminicola TaxID=458836 RepID=UPI0038B9F922